MTSFEKFTNTDYIINCRICHHFKIKKGVAAFRCRKRFLTRSCISILRLGKKALKRAIIKGHTPHYNHTKYDLHLLLFGLR